MRIFQRGKVAASVVLSEVPHIAVSALNPASRFRI